MSDWLIISCAGQGAAVQCAHQVKPTDCRFKGELNDPKCGSALVDLMLPVLFFFFYLFIHFCISAKTKIVYLEKMYKNSDIGAVSGE